MTWETVVGRDQMVYSLADHGEEIMDFIPSALWSFKSGKRTSHICDFYLSSSMWQVECGGKGESEVLVKRCGCPSGVTAEMGCCAQTWGTFWRGSCQYYLVAWVSGEGQQEKSRTMPRLLA